MKLAFDITLMRPACPLVAAGMGADTSASKLFPAELWLTTPTDDMKVYQTSPEQLAYLIARCK